jgi:hypothetical protein
VSPILVRPVREQFEHDRVIRILQTKYKKKYDAVINPGVEQNAAVAIGDVPMYPDLVLYSPERGRKLQGTVEVETSESINTLEAQAQWGPFSRLRAPFFLYVPANTIDAVRRLCTEHDIAPAEIWTYHAAGDQVRFTMVHRMPDEELRARLEKVPVQRPEGTEKGDKPGKGEKADKARTGKKTAAARSVRAEKKTPTGKKKNASAVAKTADKAAQPLRPARAKVASARRPARAAKAAARAAARSARKVRRR